MRKLLILLALSFHAHAADIYVMKNGPAGHIRLTDSECSSSYPVPEGMQLHEAIGTQFEGSKEQITTIGCWTISQPDFLQPVSEDEIQPKAAITIFSEFGLNSFLESDFIKVSGD